MVSVVIVGYIVSEYYHAYNIFIKSVCPALNCYKMPSCFRAAVPDSQNRKQAGKISAWFSCGKIQREKSKLKNWLDVKHHQKVFCFPFLKIGGGYSVKIRYHVGGWILAAAAWFLKIHNSGSAAGKIEKSKTVGEKITAAAVSVPDVLRLKNSGNKKGACYKPLIIIWFF